MITVQAQTRLHPLNPLIFGQNILFASNSLWNTREDGIDPAARSMVKDLAPTLVRFPGGTASNLYLWEDGIGFHSTTEIKPYTSSITLDGVPNWKTVHQAPSVMPQRRGLGNALYVFAPGGQQNRRSLRPQGLLSAGVCGPTGGQGRAAGLFL